MAVPGTSTLVSVILPVSHNERHADAALRAVYEQDHAAAELIVVANEPGHAAGDVLRGQVEREEMRTRFRRIVFVQQSDGLGASHAINRGLEESHGDFVNVVEPGDGFATDRFSRLLSACAEGSAELAFSRAEPRLDAPAFGPSPSVSRPEADLVYSLQEDIDLFPTVGYALLRGQCALSTGNLFFSRRLAERVAGFGDYADLYGWDFALRCVLVTEPLYVPESLYFYPLRARARSLTQQAQMAAETESILKNYLFQCQNRPVANALAPSPAWGPFFRSFVQASRYAGYLARP